MVQMIICFICNLNNLKKAIHIFATVAIFDIRVDERRIDSVPVAEIPTTMFPFI